MSSHSARKAASSAISADIAPAYVNLLVAFGKRLAHRRISVELTQDAMIKQLNRISGEKWGRSSASVWENGHSPPDFVTIHFLAKLLHTTPEYLAYGIRKNEVAEVLAKVLRGHPELIETVAASQSPPRMGLEPVPKLTRKGKSRVHMPYHPRVDGVNGYGDRRADILSTKRFRSLHRRVS